MRNEHSSDGIAEDIIRSFVQFGSAEMHIKTLIEKNMAKLENPSEDDDPEKINMDLMEYDWLLEECASLRRKSMLHIFEMYDGNKDAWCLVKHLGIGSMQMFEAYQASEEDPELYGLWIDSNKAFIKSLSIFLGIEITDCAACFADMLKEK